MVRNYDIRDEYIKRYGSFKKVKPKKTILDVIKKKFMSEGDLATYNELKKLYHPLFVDILFCGDVTLEELSDILSKDIDSTRELCKDPMLNMTLYDAMRIADILYDDADNIVMHVLQRDFRMNKRKPLEYDKLVEEKVMRDIRIKRDKAWNAKLSYKDILARMMKKMV